MAETLSIGGTLGAANAIVPLSVAGMGGVAIQIQGTFSGTITFEASVQGQYFAPFRVVPSDNSTAVTTATSTGLWTGSTVGYAVVRVRMSSYTSGKAVVFLQAELSSPGGSGGGGGVGSDVNLIEVGGASIALGQTTMSASLPVTMASDQGAIDVNITGGGGSGGTSSDFGDPFPSAGTAIGIADPDGNMHALSAETFDYDTGAGTVAGTALGIAIPASGGPVPVLGGHGTAAQALRVELPTDGTGVIATVGAVTALTNALPAGTNVIGHVITDTGSTTAVTGNVTVVQPTGTNLHVVTDSGTITTVSTVSSVTAVGTITPGTAASSLGKAEDAAHSSGDVGVFALGVANEAQTTFAADGDYIARATDTKGNALVVGNLADDAASAGNPVRVGAVAKSPDGSDPGNVSAENDVAALTSDLNRRLLVNTAHPWALRQNLQGSSAYTDTQVFDTPGSGKQTVITSIIASTGAATALNFFLEEGSTKIFGPIYLEAVAGRGFCSGPIYLPITADTAVTITSSASIAQSFNILGFIQKV